MLESRLKALRIESGKTQEAVSEMLNIARGTYAHYELGKRRPDYDTLLKFADFFNVTIDYLLGRSDNSAIRESMPEYSSSCSIDVSGLPEEAVLQVKEYVEFLRQKYKNSPV